MGWLSKTYRPISNILSSILWSCLFCAAAPYSSLNCGFPGCIIIATTIPRKALNIDVRTKYSKVLTAILPLILAFKLAEPAIKLAMINGRINSFKSRMNSSPGYAITINASGPKWYGLRPRPVREKKNKNILIDVSYQLLPSPSQSSLYRIIHTL